MRAALFRWCSLLFTLSLLFSLTGCEKRRTQDIWNAGHEAGYQDGLNDALSGNLLPLQPSTKISGQSQERDDTPNPAKEADFVSLSRAVPDAILELRYATTYNFVGERIPGYENPVALLRREAAEALQAVSEDLMAQGYRLKIYDAYRPQQATDRFNRWAMDLDDQKMKPFFYPNVEKAVLVDRGYIDNRSVHSRGTSVDVTLLDMRTGRVVDMGTNFGHFDPKSQRNHTEGLTQEQISNRRLLQKSMEARGFKASRAEWWHFSLKNESQPDIYYNFPLQDPED